MAGFKCRWNDGPRPLLLKLRTVRKVSAKSPQSLAITTTLLSPLVGYNHTVGEPTDPGLDGRFHWRSSDERRLRTDGSARIWRPRRLYRPIPSVSHDRPRTYGNNHIVGESDVRGLSGGAVWPLNRGRTAAGSPLGHRTVRRIRWSNNRVSG